MRSRLSSLLSPLLSLLLVCLCSGLLFAAGCAQKPLPEEEEQMSTPPLDLDELLRTGCAAATAQADRVPVYTHFVLDGSGSMRYFSKWEAVVPALNAIFEDLRRAADPSVGVGLTIFADANDVTIGETTAGPYDKMDVPIAFVDDAQLARLKGRLNFTQPHLGTPTYEVLSGQFPLLASFAPSAPLLPGGKRVLVFITDGVPDPDMPAGENEVPWSLALVRKMASDKDAPIPTFAVGVGPLPPTGPGYSPVFMGELAVAGGTRSSPTCDPKESQDEARVCYLQVTPPASGAPTPMEVERLRDKFVSTLTSIQRKAAVCEYSLMRINQERMGAVDPAKINVVYTAPDGARSLIPQSPTSGWTYDDPKSPTRVFLHGEACTRAQNEPRSSVTIVLGCVTVQR